MRGCGRYGEMQAPRYTHRRGLPAFPSMHRSRHGCAHRTTEGLRHGIKLLKKFSPFAGQLVKTDFNCELLRPRREIRQAAERRTQPLTYPNEEGAPFPGE